MYDLPTVTASGSREDLGRVIGTTLCELIRRFVPMRFASAQTYMSEIGRGDLDSLLAVGQRCYRIFERWDPAAFVEHKAIATAAGVDQVELFTAGNMTDLRDVVLLSGEPTTNATMPADAEGCTAVLVPGSHTADGAIVVGQTWDLNPDDVDYVVAVHRRPDDGPATWSVTVAGCPSLVGMNDRGFCVGTTNVKTWGSRDGIGYMNVLHRALCSTSFDAATAVIDTAPVAGAHTYWLADARRIFEWETTPDNHHRRDVVDRPFARTNHCLHPPHVARHGEPPSSSSLQRRQRAQAWLERGNHTVETLQELFCDRVDGVDSINRRPEDDQGTATDAVIIAVPEPRDDR